MLKFEVTEKFETKRKHYSGWKMTTSTSGRRVKTNGTYQVATGLFTGRVFLERTETVTGDWGSGPETKTSVVEKTIAEIASDADRELVERRTKAIFDALSRDY
jgi:hypothetical protein